MPRRFAAVACLLLASRAFAAAGDLDATFGTNGRLRLPLPNNDTSIAAATLQPDGKLVLAGQGRGQTTARALMVVRLNIDGSLDTSFSGDGYAFVQSPHESRATAVAITADNRIVVAGVASYIEGNNFHSVPVAARLNSDGSPDASFGAGIAREFAFDLEIYAVALLPDGRFVLGGNTFNGQGTGDYGFVRANADGSIDTTFGTAGRVSVDFNQTGDQLVGLVRLPDGRLIGVGNSYSSTGTKLTTIRLLANGALDTIVNGGKLGYAITGIDVATAVSLQGDKLLIAANGSSPHGVRDLGMVLRINTDGALDSTFGSGGRIVRAHPIFGVAADSERVYFAGSEFVDRFSDPNPIARGFAGAVERDGAGAVNFAPGGRTVLDFGNAGNQSRFSTFALLRMADGRLIVLGNRDTQEIVAARLVATGGHAGVISISRRNPFEFFSGNYYPESNAPLEFKVERTGGSSGAVSVSYLASGPDSVAGTDFATTAGTLTWGDGETAAKFVMLPLIDDHDYEPIDETINLQISAPTGGASLGTTTIVSRTLSDETIVNVNIFPQRVLESEGTALLRVERAGDTRLRSTVKYRINPVSAVAGVDYSAAPSGEFTWESGDRSDRFVTVALLNSPTTQGGSLEVELYDPSFGSQVHQQGRGLLEILDDDHPTGAPHPSRLFNYVSESAGSVTISIGRPLNDTVNPVTLNLLTSSGDPSVRAGVDFGQPNVSKLTWAANDFSRRSVTIPIYNDSIAELHESFDLTSPEGGYVAVIMILDDEADPGPARFSFSQPVYHISEALGAIRLQVNRSGDISKVSRIEVGIDPRTAFSPDDFPGPPFQPLFTQVLNWAPDETTPQFVEFPIVNDNISEPDDTLFFMMRLFPEFTFITGAQTTTKVFIDNDDGTFTPRVGFSQDAITVSEDADFIDLPVVRTGTGADALGSFTVRDGSTADAAVEFVVPSGPAYFEFREPSAIEWPQNVRVYLNGDARAEGDETFTVDLEGLEGFMPVGRSSLTVTLVSNDVNVPPVPMQIGFAQSAVSQAENNTAVSLTVSRTGPATSALSVHYETLAGTALAVSDFIAASGDLQWAAGDGADKTIVVNLVNDTDVEGTETLSVRLSVPANGATLTAADTATISITNDDSASAGGGVSGSSSGGKGKGGGGAFDASLVALLLTLLARRRVPRRATYCAPN